jgi:single-strand DNA-binding protein
MSTLRNRVMLIGHLGQTPETKHFDNGNSLSKFSIATNETHKNEKGEFVTEAQWHNLVLWGNLAKTAEKYLDKGKEVIVEGKLHTKTYTDKEGVKRYFTEILVSDLVLMSPKTSKEKNEVPF